MPAMNIYETALLDGPNWKSISVAGAERTRERQRENELKGGKNCTALLPRFSSVFIVPLPYTAQAVQRNRGKWVGHMEIVSGRRWPHLHQVPLTNLITGFIMLKHHHYVIMLHLTIYKLMFSKMNQLWSLSSFSSPIQRVLIFSAVRWMVGCLASRILKAWTSWIIVGLKKQIQKFFSTSVTTARKYIFPQFLTFFLQVMFKSLVSLLESR